MYIHGDITYIITIYVKINCDILLVGMCMQGDIYFLETHSQGTEILGI